MERKELAKCSIVFLALFLSVALFSGCASPAGGARDLQKPVLEFDWSPFCKDKPKECVEFWVDNRYIELKCLTIDDWLDVKTYIKLLESSR